MKNSDIYLQKLITLYRRREDLIDNKRMSPQIVNHLFHLTYEQQAEVWERHCKDCPFSTVKTIENNRIVKYKHIDDARDVLLTEYIGTSEKYILRGCNFGDEDFSLQEICANSCRFWKDETCEGGSGQPDKDPIEEVTITEEPPIHWTEEEVKILTLNPIKPELTVQQELDKIMRGDFK